jgi:hypothetical protein
VLQGWLLKRGEKGLVKGWKKRWFIFKSGKLYYYSDNSTGAKCLGFIDVEAASEVVTVSSSQAATFTFEVRPWLTGGCACQVHNCCCLADSNQVNASLRTSRVIRVRVLAVRGSIPDSRAFTNQDGATRLG